MDRHHLIAVLAGLLWVLTASCDTARPSPGPTLRDSAGVTIVDHGSLVLESLPPWYLAEPPELTIGVQEGREAYQFYGVLHAHRRRDGSIAVIDRSLTIRVFDSAGTHLWTAGGGGEGPGEFRWPQMISEIRGDSLAVWDRAANRLSVFSPDGRFARTATLQNFAGNAPCWGLAGPDRLLIEHRAAEHARLAGHDAYTYHANLFLVDLNGVVVDSLGRWFYATEYQEVDARGAYSPAIFATPAVIAPAPGGFWYGDTETYELRRATGSGGIERILRWQGPDRSISDSDVEAVLDSWGGGSTTDPDLQRFIREYGRTHPRAEQFPAYEAILTDAVGRVWVRDFVWAHTDDGLRRWTVFSSDGSRVLGRLSHAAEFRPLDVRDDSMLGVETDDMAVERIVLRKIVRR